MYIRIVFKMIQKQNGLSLANVAFLKTNLSYGLIRNQLGFWGSNEFQNGGVHKAEMRIKAQL